MNGLIVTISCLRTNAIFSYLETEEKNIREVDNQDLERDLIKSASL